MLGGKGGKGYPGPHLENWRLGALGASGAAGPVVVSAQLERDARSVFRDDATGGRPAAVEKGERRSLVDDPAPSATGR